MGCFYTGFDYKNRKNGYFKIGETDKKTPAARWAQIRQGDSFQGLYWMRLINETTAERRAVESHVRVMMERLQGLTHVQNDHFTYDIEQGRKYEQAWELSAKAIEYAKKACAMYGIKYEMGTKQYKRG